jgi:ubiquinone/menaquinone biosynthesis C-methylase UbiE
MGLYSRYIFPRILEAVLSTPEITAYRQEVLKATQGEILEIGVGTGLNFPCYPDKVQHITTIDTNSAMHTFAIRRAQARGLEVRHTVLSAERLPFPDNSFDTVVSTWTLCSIPNVAAALAEVRRVVKPGGRFLFCEHGASPDAQVHRWQNRLTPINKLIGDGCHLNRNIEDLIHQAGLKFHTLDKFYTGQAPRIFSYFYRGQAYKLE